MLTDKEKQDFQWKLEHCKIAYQAVIDYSKIALNGLVLANGGAVISILTFLGAVWKDSDDRAQGLAGSLIFAIGSFTLGLAFALIATMLTYISQLKFVEGYTSKDAQRGDGPYNAAVGCGVGSLGAFIIGVIVAVGSFT